VIIFPDFLLVADIVEKEGGNYTGSKFVAVFFRRMSFVSSLLENTLSTSVI